MSIAQALRAQRDTTVDLRRLHKGRPVVLRVRVGRVSTALTMQHGSAQTLLVSGVVTALRRSEEQARASRMEGELKGMLAEVARREAALASLSADELADAVVILAQKRDAVVAHAKKIADLKALALETTAKEVLRQKPDRLAEQHAAIVAAGVTGWALVEEGQEQQEPVWEEVTLTTIVSEEDPAQGRLHVSVFSQDELFQLSEAIYDHSVGGAGGRLALERFRHHAPGSGGAAVEAERGAEPAPPRADPAQPLRPDPDLHLSPGGGDRAPANDRERAGDAGGDGLTDQEG